MAKNTAAKRSIVWEFLGSMNLAIALLVMLAIASVIGTVLQQNQPYNDYLIKFGPFWFEVFEKLSLYTVYGAIWFMLVLAFLLFSTSTCVYRNGPQFIRDMKSYKDGVSKLSLKRYQFYTQVDNASPAHTQGEKVEQWLNDNQFKFKRKEDNGEVSYFAKKGSWNRLGYFFTHIGIVVICIGALFDSNLPLTFSKWTGELVAETQSRPLKNIPDESWIDADNGSFRGSVTVPEGKATDVVFLPYENGYFVQRLPFRVQVDAFEVKYYETGMPKSFESKLKIFDPEFDPEMKTPAVEKTIAVNHPLIYKGIAIYQSSFSDGGTKLKMDVWPMIEPDVIARPMNSAVDQVEALNTPLGQYRLEFSDFRMFNIRNLDEEEQKEANGKKVKNNGPSVLFKVRDEQGQAFEYDNYMMPVDFEGRKFFLSGSRASVADPFKYLYIPADEQNSINRFMAMMNYLNDVDKLRQVLTVETTGLTDEQLRNAAMQEDFMQKLVMLFRNRGFDGIRNFVLSTIPEDRQQEAETMYMDILKASLSIIYGTVLEAEGKVLDGNMSDFDQQFFDDAVFAMSGLHLYGSPVFVQLKGFNHIEASGLQMTKSPGQDTVYFGSVLLIVGVFLMFYVRQRRIWVHLDGTSAQLAMQDNKTTLQTTQEFDRIKSDFNDIMKA